MTENNDEYIDLNELPINNDEDNNKYNDIEIDSDTDNEKQNSSNYQKIYQVIPETKSAVAQIRHVGNFNKTPTVSINTFRLNKKINCDIISCLHSENDLYNLEDKGKFDVIKILVFKKNKMICTLTGSFYTFIHKKNKKPLKGYLSTKDKQIGMEGFYIIMFQYMEGNIMKTLQLEHLKTFPEKSLFIQKMILHLTGKTVSDLLKSIVKNN